MTAVNGLVVWAAKYSSFGKAEVDPASTVENNLRFAGQYEDQETGYHYNWWRYYNSETGRYSRADPIGLKGGINLFAYVLNNPVNAMDPMGLWTPRNHNTITKDAAKKECPKLLKGCPGKEDSLPELTALADFIEGTQEPENAYQHSMRDGSSGQSETDARKKRDEWINKKLLPACDKGSLARALHAIQDEYSESHTFKPWYGWGRSPNNTINPLFPIWHVWKDSFGGYGKPRRNAVQASIDLIRRFKQQCPSLCE